MKDINKIKRSPDRAIYDKNSIIEILANNFLCHIAVNTEQGPICIPMFYFLFHNQICIHGSRGSRLMNLLKSARNACVSITKVNGLVLSRSAFHHSLNYESVVVHGIFTEPSIDSHDLLIREMIESIAEGRSKIIRQPSKEELAQSIFLLLPITTAAAKRRAGPPKEDPSDLDADVWAGEIPLETSFKTPIPDSFMKLNKNKTLKDLLGAKSQTEKRNQNKAIF